VLKYGDQVRQRFVEPWYIRIGWNCKVRTQAVQQRMRDFMGDDVV
jgi:hypothetical protein